MRVSIKNAFFKKILMIKIKLLFTSLIISLLALNFGSCTDDTISNFDPLPQISLLGFWTSENTNIATILQDSIQRINLEFLEDTTYLMTVTDTAGYANTYLGRFFFDESDTTETVFPITLEQLSPDTVFYSGIYEINNNLNPNELTIEWVNTSSSNNVTPPTVVDGFGSTDNGSLGVQNVQKYIKF